MQIQAQDFKDKTFSHHNNYMSKRTNHAVEVPALRHVLNSLTLTNQRALGL